MSPLLDANYDKKKAYAAERVIEILDGLENSLYKKADYEAREEIDFTHPKIQKAFLFVVEAVIETMKEIGIEPAMIDTFLIEFGFRMVGFEEELTKRMKGLSAQTLDKVENPLLKKFQESKTKKDK